MLKNLILMPANRQTMGGPSQRSTCNALGISEASVRFGSEADFGAERRARPLCFHQLSFVREELAGGQFKALLATTLEGQP